MDKPEDKFWIGLTDSQEEDEWIWVNNTRLDPSLKFWLLNEPNNWTGPNPDGEDCVRKREGNSVKPKSQKTRPKEYQPVPQSQSPGETMTLRRPRPWYCFKCGEDGHISTSCSNPPNPVLVDAKRMELREKQQAWDKKNASRDPLN